ncbi:hypothetical protein NPIL_454741, partial [Nephila pilipes]
DLLQVPTGDHPTSSSRHSSPLSSTEYYSDLGTQGLVSSSEYKSLPSSGNRSVTSSVNSDSSTLTPLKSVPEDTSDPSVLTSLRRQPAPNGLSVKYDLKSSHADSPPLLPVSVRHHRGDGESDIEVLSSEEVEPPILAGNVELFLKVPEEQVTDCCGSCIRVAKKFRSYIFFVIRIFIVVLAVGNICVGIIYWNKCRMDTTALILTGICGVLGVLPTVITIIFARFITRKPNLTILTCTSFTIGSPLIAL